MQEPILDEESPRPAKSPEAFRTISEVAETLNLPQHVLRFWETRFSQIRPLKRGGGRRYYRPDDVDLLKGIRHLLYGEGYTIKGVQRILKEEGSRFVQSVGRGEQQVAAPAGSRAAQLAANASSVSVEGINPTGSEVAEPELSGSLGAAAEREPGGVHGAEVSAAHKPALSYDDLERLRGALGELQECERVLAALHVSSGSIAVE